MVELIGDICQPSDMRLPLYDTVRTDQEGDIFISGHKIWFHDGTSNKLVTSA